MATIEDIAFKKKMHSGWWEALKRENQFVIFKT